MATDSTPPRTRRVPGIQADASGAGDISLWPARDAALTGQWAKLTDATAAGGAAVWYPDAGAAKLPSPSAQPASYFELTFDARGGIPYRLWLRMRAQDNYWGNDSVFVQFSGSVTSSGTASYRIGTTGGATVNLEEASNAGVSGWGWQDNGYGAGVLGPAIYFESSGRQVLRVQSREDGAIIDQILLSPSTYISAAPGATTNDTVILPSSTIASPPTVTLVRGPYLQQVGASAATVVWATREPGAAEVRYAPAGEPASAAAASSRLVPASTTGFSYDYYQHEATLTGLAASTLYTYDPFVSGVDVTPEAGQLRTAPPSGSGAVKFVAFGDSGTGSAEQHQIASLVAADTFDIALHAGDIAYGTTTGTGDASYLTYQSWFFDIYQPWLGFHPFFPVEGNHDSRPSNNNGAAYLDLFALARNGASPMYPDHAERYYSFDYGPVHFVALDTEFAFQDITRRSEQIAWLDSDLASTSQPWKIAFFHRSPYSAGGEHGSDLDVRSTFGPLFERYDVRLVISAHEHDYERTRPMREGSSGSEVTYLVTGGGGGPLYSAGTAAWTAYSASRHHYLRASVDSCTIQVTAIGLDGAAFDGTTLSRCAAPSPGALPETWTHQDIGAVGVAGSATYDAAASAFTVTGAGADVWGTADALHYAARTLTGDGRIVARVVSVDRWDIVGRDASAWAKAGVMIRAALDASSAQAFMLVSPAKGVAFQRRAVPGGASVNTAGVMAATPYWVRLDRTGSTVTAYQSGDGVAWTMVGADTITLPADVSIGLGVSSHSTSSAATAVFDHVVVTAASAMPPQNVTRVPFKKRP